MIYVFLAEGFEEIEAIAPIDILRRAGFYVTTVGVTGKTVTGSHGISITADITVRQLVIDDDMDMMVLPGGMPGTKNLEKNQIVMDALAYCFKKKTNAVIGAICAAPSILGHAGVLEGKTAVCYTGFEAQLQGATIGTQGVVTDGRIVTARGAGVAIDFGLALVEALCGKEKMTQIRASMLCD